MALWNDKRTPAGVVTDTTTGRSGPMDRAHEWMKGYAAEHASRTPVSDADHAVLDAAWHKSFADLKAAGVAHDADHPVAAAYRAASNAVNHANRSRDYGIATGRIKSKKVFKK